MPSLLVILYTTCVCVELCKLHTKTLIIMWAYCHLHKCFFFACVTVDHRRIHSKMFQSTQVEKTFSAVQLADFYAFDTKFVHMKSCHISPFPLLPKSLLQPAHQQDTLHLSLLPPLLPLTNTSHIQEPQIFLLLTLHYLLHSWYFTETFGSSFDTKGKAPQQFSLSHNFSSWSIFTFLYPITQIF